MKKPTRELIDYGIWGVATVGFNMLSFLLLELLLPYQIANLISIVLTKMFAYMVNKLFVFKTKSGIVDTLKEMVRFILARAATGVVDYFGLIILVEIVMVDSVLGKAVMIVITTVMNYILGKYKVFVKKEK